MSTYHTTTEKKNDLTNNVVFFTLTDTDMDNNITDWMSRLV